jgi:predicted glycoside hydrolase/deacetylase ChbG (UPF0249 family)
MSRPSSIILHQDDVGMCHGANVAFRDLSATGTITSGSVMVPCPWFSEAAEMARENSALDLGVHLTLTAEKLHYRWSPLIGSSKSSGLVDDDGYMWRDVASVRKHADPRAAAEELRAQLERAVASGFDVTHLDAHMGAVLAPEFCGEYLRLADEYEIPALMTRTLAAYGPNNHLAGVTESQFAEFVQEAERLNIPLIEQVLETDFGRPFSRAVERHHYEDMFSEAASGERTGWYFAALHPNTPGEVEIIEPDHSHVRTDEFHIFGSDEYVAWLRGDAIRTATMRQLRDEMRRARRVR